MAKLTKEQRAKNFLIFRSEKLDMLQAKKISHNDFSELMYGYIHNKKVKNIIKPNDPFSIIFNYYFWMTHIERKCMKERSLLKYDLGSLEEYYRVSEVFRDRRDFMVRRMLERLNYTVKDVYLVEDTLAEVVFNEIPNTTFFCSIKSLKKSQIEIFKIKSSKIDFYLPLISFNRKVY